MGIATNKLVAQIASKLRKPRGFVVVPPGEEPAFMAPLALGRLPGIGAKTEAALAREGLCNVSDLFLRGESELAAILGRDWRRVLAEGRGEDDSSVETESEDAKSYSKQETFPENEGDFAAVERVAKRMLDELLPLVRADRAAVRTMTVKVRYGDFTQESHGQSLEASSDIEASFYPLVAPLLRGAWKKRRPLRLVSVRLSGVEAGPRQLEMFGQADDKRRNLAGVLDKLNRAGKDPIVMHGHQLPDSKPRT
jgi:DNA polymerase-4